MIIPAILESLVALVQEKVNRVKGLAQRVHIDVIDGVFADNMTVSPADLLGVDFGDLEVDLHLMTEEPVDFIDESAQLREQVASLRVIGQVERMGNREDFVKEALKAGCEVGLALDLYTPVTAVDASLYQDLHSLLVMSVRSGQQGQVFQQRSIASIRDVTRTKSQLSDTLSLIVDGGLNPDIVRLCGAAGADDFAVGSWLWRQHNLTQALVDLEQAFREK